MSEQELRHAAMRAIETAQAITRKAPVLTQERITTWADIFAAAAPWMTEHLAVQAVRAHYAAATEAVAVAEVIALAKTLRSEGQKRRTRPYGCGWCHDTGTVCNSDGVPISGRPRCDHSGVWTVTTASDKGMA